MDNNQIIHNDINLTLPLIFCICLSSVVFKCLVSHFYVSDVPVEGLGTNILSHEQTFAILQSMGLEHLGIDGMYMGLINLYLFHMNWLLQLVYFDLNTLNHEVLMSILHQLRFLICVHDLILEIFRNFISMLEGIDLDIDIYEDFPYDAEVDIRNTGNNLYLVYRRIEYVLGIDTGLPFHESEIEAYNLQ